MELQNLLSKTNELMGSREIAQITGKEHRSVLRDIDNLNDSYEKLGLHKVVQSSYKNEQGREFREMKLSKIQTLDLATGYDVSLRIKVNRRWEELENKTPTSFSEALKLAYEQSLVIEEQARTIEEQAPKVLFSNAIIGSKSSCLVGELAKMISQNGFEIGQNRLFDYFRENGYVAKSGERRNLPNQRYIEQGLFEIKKGTRSGNDGVMYHTTTTKVTGKGQAYFINKFLK